jgi:hypothetical protein
MKTASAHESPKESENLGNWCFFSSVSLGYFAGTNIHELIREIRTIRGSGCKEIQAVR